MSKHTPGPWLPVRDAQGICGLMHPTKKQVAVAWLSSTFRPAGGYVGEDECELGRPEREANAHLIAAAPDLLAALETAIADGRLQTFEDRERFRAEARAAIAKAKGE